MDHNAFFSRLKSGDIGGLFLFHGEEEYVKQSALRQITESIEPATRDLNLLVLRSPTVQSVLEASETLPFFADRRLIICHDMADAEIKLLLPAANELPDTTTLILYLRGACKKDLLQAAQSTGRDVKFDSLSTRDAQRFVEKCVRECGASIPAPCASLLVEMVGLDAHVLRNEAKKAAQFAGLGKEVTESIVRDVVTPNPEYAFFGIVDLFVAGKKEAGLTALRNTLRDDPGSAFALAHSFVRPTKQMLTARLLLDTGVKEQQIAARLNAPPGAAQAAVRGAKRCTAAFLSAAVRDFCAVDYLQVSGRAPAEQALELAAMKYF